MLKLTSSIRGGESPADSRLSLVAFGLQGANLSLQCLLIANAAMQTLFAEHAELNLRHI